MRFINSADRAMWMAVDRVSDIDDGERHIIHSRADFSRINAANDA